MQTINLKPTNIKLNNQILLKVLYKDKQFIFFNIIHNQDLGLYIVKIKNCLIYNILSPYNEYEINSFFVNIIENGYEIFYIGIDNELTDCKISFVQYIKISDDEITKTHRQTLWRDYITSYAFIEINSKIHLYRDNINLGHFDYDKMFWIFIENELDYDFQLHIKIHNILYSVNNKEIYEFFPNYEKKLTYTEYEENLLSVLSFEDLIYITTNKHIYIYDVKKNLIVCEDQIELECMPCNIEYIDTCDSVSLPLIDFDNQEIVFYNLPGNYYLTEQEDWIEFTCSDGVSVKLPVSDLKLSYFKYIKNKDIRIDHVFYDTSDVVKAWLYMHLNKVYTPIDVDVFDVFMFADYIRDLDVKNKLFYICIKKCNQEQIEILYQVCSTKQKKYIDKMKY